MIINIDIDIQQAQLILTVFLIILCVYVMKKTMYICSYIKNNELRNSQAKDTLEIVKACSNNNYNENTDNMLLDILKELAQIQEKVEQNNINADEFVDLLNNGKDALVSYIKSEEFTEKIASNISENSDKKIMLSHEKSNDTVNNTRIRSSGSRSKKK